MRYYLEYRDDKSNKFWQLELADSDFTVTFGKIGVAGQSQKKSFSSAEEAKKEAEKLAAAKRKKGYVDVAQGASPADSGEIGRRAAQMAELVKEIKSYKRDLGPRALDFYKRALKKTMGDIDHEADLFELAVAQPLLRPSLLAVFNAAMSAFSNNNIFWIDDETQAGFLIARGFALAAKTDVPLLTKFVDCCDIDHEVNIDKAVLAVWDKWGFCPETCDLLVSYMIQSQFGIELLAELNEKTPALGAVMQDEKNANLFLAHIRKWLVGAAPRAELYRDDLDDLEELLADTFEVAFGLDDDEAEQSAAAYIELYEDEKTPKISQVLKRRKTPARPGSGEQLLAAVMGALDSLAGEVWANCQKWRPKTGETPAGIFDAALKLQPPSLADMCGVELRGQKRNELVYRANSDSSRMNWASWAAVKFKDTDYSGVPDSFFETRLVPEVAAWLKSKVDARAYGDLFGGWVDLRILVDAPGKGEEDFEYEGMVENKEQQTAWLDYFRQSIQKREFENWTYYDFESGINFWRVFAFAEQLDAATLADFLSKAGRRVYIDIEPYIKEYYERLRQKKDLNKDQAKGFLAALEAAANISFDLTLKELPFYEEAKSFAETAIAGE